MTEFVLGLFSTIVICFMVCVAMLICILSLIFAFLLLAFIDWLGGIWKQFTCKVFGHESIKFIGPINDKFYCTTYGITCGECIGNSNARLCNKIRARSEQCYEENIVWKEYTIRDRRRLLISLAKKMRKNFCFI